jgi:hypothetical protein
VPGQPGQKAKETPISTNKAGCDSVCLSFQLCGKYKLDDHCLGQPRQKCETLFGKTSKTKRAGCAAQVIRVLA